VRARRALLGLVGAALAALPTDALAQGCAMCSTYLQGRTDPLTSALNTSILFMVSMPYVIVGTVGGWIYFASRRRRDAALDEPPSLPSPTHESSPSSKGDAQ
jgi:hypothetical protein